MWLQAVDDPQGDSEDDGPVEWISFWKPNITINLVDDFTRYACSEGQVSVRFYLISGKSLKEAPSFHDVT